MSTPSSTVPPDLELTPIGGESRTMAEQTTLFHLVVAVIDPYTYESSWLLETAGRVLTTFLQADCRVAWLVTAPEEDARRFLGPWAERIMTFADPDRKVVAALDLAEIPALVHIGNDLSVIGRANGWDPAEWRAITDNLATMMSWNRPMLPATGDPVAFSGTPAAG
jgi:hypothetical protein